MNKHRNIIEKSYTDLCTIYRIENTKDQYKKNKQQETEVYSNQKCKLIFGSLYTPNLKNNINKQTANPKVLINPEVIIQSGDKIVVTSKGRNYNLIAGFPSVYETHQEVPLEYKELS